MVTLFVTILTIPFVKSRTASAHRELSSFPKIGIQLGDIYICSPLTSKDCFLFFFVLILNDEHNLLWKLFTLLVIYTKAYDNADKRRSIPREPDKVIAGLD